MVTVSKSMVVHTSQVPCLFFVYLECLGARHKTKSVSISDHWYHTWYHTYYIWYHMYHTLWYKTNGGEEGRMSVFVCVGWLRGVYR